MLIDRSDEYFYEAHMTFEDLEFIVCAANIAGYLEANDKIYVDSDTPLTEFILDKFVHWFGEESENTAFEDYIADQLINEFGIEED